MVPATRTFPHAPANRCLFIAWTWIRIPARAATRWRCARIQGNRLTVSAPNLDAGWNDRLKPVRVKERIDSVTVERSKNLGGEITNRYRQSREEGRHKAEKAITELGGREKFDQRRMERLQENRRQAETQVRRERPATLPPIRNGRSAIPPAGVNPASRAPWWIRIPATATLPIDSRVSRKPAPDVRKVGRDLKILSTTGMPVPVAMVG